MSKTQPYDDCSCIECSDPTYFDPETGVQLAPRAVSFSQMMDDELIAAMFYKMAPEQATFVWPIGMLEELVEYVERREDKYIMADEYAYDEHLEQCEFANEYYGKLSGCLRCGEIVTTQRYQLLSMGVCHKCAANGLRGNLADEFNEFNGVSYCIGKDVYKRRGFLAIMAPHAGSAWHNQPPPVGMPNWTLKTTFIEEKMNVYGEPVEVDFPELEHPEWLLISSEELYLDRVFQRVAEALATMVWKGQMNMYVAKTLLLMLSPRMILLAKMEKVVYFQEAEYGLRL